MSLKKAAVGPVDVAQMLADILAGKTKPQTKDAPIYLNPALADEYDELAEQFNRLAVQAKDAADSTADRMATDPADPHKDQLDAIDAQIAELGARFEASKVIVRFRSYREGDQAAISAALTELGERSDENAAIAGVAQYNIGVFDLDGNQVQEKLSLADVRALIPIIGFRQWNDLATAYRELVYAAVDAPKSLRPLPSRGTVKP